MMVCWAPVLLMGYALTVTTEWHKTQNVDAPIVEVQSCERGVGLHAKASASWLYGLGLHYGVQWRSERWSVTVQPHAGLSYADHPIDAVPLRTQFELGAEASVGYGPARVGVAYWHLSNAGLKEPNIGLDMVILQMGWAWE